VIAIGTPIKRSAKRSAAAAIFSVIMLMAVTPVLICGQGDASEQSEEGAEDERRPKRKGNPLKRTLLATAKLKFGDKEVQIAFTKSPGKGPSFDQLTSLKDGSVVKFFDQLPPKLKTEIDLKFGDTIIKAGNVAKDYPGVYSLWFKKVGDGWRLVFNNEAGVFGTMHDPTADAAEIPLTVARPATSTGAFEVELKQEGPSGGLLRMAWGNHEWTTSFETAQ
jgi:hypothetical protein